MHLTLLLDAAPANGPDAGAVRRTACREAPGGQRDGRAGIGSPLLVRPEGAGRPFRCCQLRKILDILCKLAETNRNISYHGIFRRMISAQRNGESGHEAVVASLIYGLWSEARRLLVVGEAGAVPERVVVARFANSYCG